MSNQRMSARDFMAQSFHSLPEPPFPFDPKPTAVELADRRERISYVLPDGTVAPVIHDHEQRIEPTVSVQLKSGEIVSARLVDMSRAYSRAS